MGAPADKPIVFGIEFKEIRTDIPERHHSLDSGRLHLNVHSPVSKSGDMALELISDLVLHVFDKLVLDARAFSLSCNYLTLRGMLAEFLKKFLLCRHSAGKVAGKQPVDHHVRITPDRRGEMGVILESKSVMADVLRRIAGLGHGPERKEFNCIELRCILCLGEEVVEFLGNFLPVACRPHLVAEITYEIPQVCNLVLIRFIMNSIYECLRLGLAPVL